MSPRDTEIRLQWAKRTLTRIAIGLLVLGGIVGYLFAVLF